MKKKLLTFCLAAACILAVLPLQAQETKSKNVKKDLWQVLKELPPEMQQEVLSYAVRKREALARATQKTPKVAKVAEMAPKAEVAAAQKSQQAPAAVPAPQQAKAKQVTHPAPATEISLSPAPNSAATPPAAATPPTPKRPDYMEKAASLAQTTVQWYEMEHNYGKVKSGEVVKHTFRFKNTGDQPLTLTRVKASCGCTTPSYSKDPIAPGEEGFIDVSFNTTGKSGIQRKSVTITSNSNPINIALRITGEVEKP